MTQFRQLSSMPQEKQGHQQNEDKKTTLGRQMRETGTSCLKSRNRPTRRPPECDEPSAVLPRAHRSGSGGGIRTHDLWVMSPASCRCSTPRRASGWVIANHLVGCASSGLTSHAVARAVLSGAGVGHDPVRDGAGCCHTALGHAHTRREGKTLRRTGSIAEVGSAVPACSVDGREAR